MPGATVRAGDGDDRVEATTTSSHGGPSPGWAGTFDLGPGDDRVTARFGFAGGIRCGGGRDTATLTRHPLNATVATDCEWVELPRGLRVRVGSSPAVAS